MKWIPVDEGADGGVEPQRGPRQQQTPLTFTKADFENEEEEVDYDEEGKADEVNIKAYDNKDSSRRLINVSL